MENRHQVHRISILPVIQEVENDNISITGDGDAVRLSPPIGSVRFVNEMNYGGGRENEIVANGGGGSDNGDNNNEPKIKTSQSDMKFPIDMQPIQQVIYNSAYMEFNSNAATFGHQSQRHSSPHRQYHHRTVTPNGVIREQYWACPCTCRCPKFSWENWTKREKTLFLVMLGFAAIVLGLAGIIWRMARIDNTTALDWLIP